MPIRWRVTAACVAALLVVLAGLGAFVYLQLGAVLERSMDRELRVRAEEVSALVQHSPLELPRSGDLEADESPAQVLRPDGTVVAATSLTGRPLLDAAQLHAALSGPIFVDRDSDAVSDERVRLLALPVTGTDEQLVVVVGASLDEKDETLSSLLLLGAIGLGGAVVAAGAAGYLVAGVALRPVEAMRRQAEDIGRAGGPRLAVPAVDDELSRLATTINAMLDRIASAQDGERAALARQRRFVADASHELRTPLSIIKSEIEVALIRDSDRDELVAALESTAEETERLIRLTDDLLLLARADEDQLQLRVAPVPLTDLMESVARRRGPNAGRQGRSVRVEPGQLSIVDIDRTRMERALSNLVDNALIHGRGDVVLTWQMVTGAVELSVRDFGPGFPDGLTTSVLERFVRGARTGDGAGLGLAIVAAITQAHRGSVRIAGADPGAIVRITLPIVAGAAPNASSQP